MGKKYKAKYTQSKSPFKGVVSGGIAAAVAGLVYAAVFPVRSAAGGVLMALVVLAAAFLAYTMGSGLDTSKRAPQSSQAALTGDEKVDALIYRGHEMLSAIRMENERIPDADLSYKMDELESVAGKIFKAVSEQPRKAPQIRRFMDYYLPTTLKMLSGYRRMDEQNIRGEEAAETRAKIENAMDVVISAFKKQLDNLYKDDMLDISTDIDVLETLLKRDQLTNEGIRASGGQAAGAFAQQTQEEHHG